MISLPIKVINVQRARNACFQKVVPRRRNIFFSLSLSRFRYWTIPAFNSDENRTEHRYISSRIGRKILESKYSPFETYKKKAMSLSFNDIVFKLALQRNVSFESV